MKKGSKPISRPVGTSCDSCLGNCNDQGICTLDGEPCPEVNS